MSDLITLDLPRDLAQQARALAAHDQRPVEHVLLEWLYRAAADAPVESLSDEQILAARDMQMPQDQQQELGELLARQREGTLDQEARRRLDNLMTTYRRGMVRKAQALKVAVDRGLQPPLNQHGF